MSTIKYGQVEINFEAKRGDTFCQRIKYSLKNGDVTTHDDITDSDFIMCLTKDADGDNNVLTLTLGDGLEIEDDNILVVTITAEQSKDLTGAYYYDIERTYPDGTVATRPEGRINFKPDRA